MNVLFVYYLPSGGVDTLNRQRCLALRKHGIQGHCLYYRSGAGLQNAGDIPTYMTNDDAQIADILRKGCYQAIVIVSDYVSLQRFRTLGYAGPLFLEIQGLGSKEMARFELMNAIPYIQEHCNGIVFPGTPHIASLLQELYPLHPRFAFHNPFDSDSFAYRALPRLPYRVAAWMGRIEDNKNWREFLLIGHRLVQQYDPQLQLWMFEDATLSAPAEREAFRLLMQQLQLESRLTLFSNVPHAEMPRYFSQIGDSGGLLCSTSKVEGAPYAVLEAMSCCCPVLSTRSDGVFSSIIHDHTGKYYDLGNIEQAYFEAAELMNSASLRGQILYAARQHVQTHFHPELYSFHFIRMIQHFQ